MQMYFACPIPPYWIMIRLALLTGFLLAAGCQSTAGLRTPVMSCADAQFAGVTARMASDLDEPPVPEGGLEAVQSRVRVVNEGGGQMRQASAADRFAVIRAVVDTTGAVVCSDVLSASTAAKGDAAQEAVHRSSFVPGRFDGAPVPSVLDLTLDVRGQGVSRVVTGAELGMAP